jgi:microcystin-dependent protein
MSISENEVLFNAVGTTYGGDGQTTFKLPDLRSRVPVHMGRGPDGNTYTIGEAAGAESVTLTQQEMAAHTHAAYASSSSATATVPGGHVLAKAVSNQPGVRFYRPPAATVAMDAQAITPQGGSHPHENMQPFLVINYIIALDGIFPTP